LTFIGNIKNQPLFQLNFTGEANYDEYTITIKDEAGITLYRENIKGGSFTKKFLINTEELGNTTLKFEIASKNSKSSVFYEVNRSSQVVEKVEVSKL